MKTKKKTATHGLLSDCTLGIFEDGKGKVNVLLGALCLETIERFLKGDPEDNLIAGRASRGVVVHTSDGLHVGNPATYSLLKGIEELWVISTVCVCVYVNVSE